jgi:PPP family 3-phenylpropionic acid transporter
LYAFCFGPVEPLLSNTALELLRGRTEQYGKVRLWGALGWGLLAPLFGQLVEQYGRTSSFYIHGLLILIGLLVALRLPKPSRAATDTKFSQGLRRLLADRRGWWFLLIVLVGGIAESMVHNFWFIYLKSLGASGALMGFSMTIAMVSELLVFFYADRLLKRFGPRRMLIFGVSMHLIRLVAFSVIQQPYLAILFQLLHGPAYAVIWTAAVAQANRLAPEGLGATAQGLLTSVSFGMALSVGALLGGFLYEQVGIFATYRWMALLVLAGLTAFIVGSRAHTATVRPATRPVEVISY